MRGRILCVTSNFPRWTGDTTTPFILHLAQDLQKIGWEITILAPHAPGCVRHEKMGNIRVERFYYLWPSFLETVCYQGGALINLRKNRLNYLKLPFLLLSEFIHISKRLRTGGYDLLHSHWLLPQGFIGALAAHATKTPHLITVHGSDVFSLNKSLYRKCKQMALSMADAVTANSSETVKAVTSLDPYLRDLHQIPMGASTPPADVAYKAKALRTSLGKEDSKLLIFAGRIAKEKGLEELLRAMQLLIQKNLPVHALIVGEGQDRGSFERRRDSLGLQSQVTFTGWVDPDSIPYYLAAGDVFVSPSWFEGQGLTVIEAMLAGAPVVATEVGGIIDSVEHEKTGLLVPVHAPEAIAAAVERLLTDQPLAHEMAARAKKNASAKFSRQASAEAFSKLYQAVIGKKTKPL